MPVKDMVVCGRCKSPNFTSDTIRLTEKRTWFLSAFVNVWFTGRCAKCHRWTKNELIAERVRPGTWSLS
jgi:predicted nucleic-acid-binding Zn-ribbon protein